MKKNSNTYQILYSAIMVIVVGAVLAFVFMTLKGKQDQNKANDKRMQILSAIHVAPASADSIESTFSRYITAEYLVDPQGNIADSTRGVAFGIDMKKNVKAQKRQLPVFVSKIDGDSIKYIVPVYGAGLWGPIWGYVAVNADGKTVYGANFSHEGETPGLGARITDDSHFHQSFEGKSLYQNTRFTSVEVVKKGQKGQQGGDYVDALSGATITSHGVSEMLQNCLLPYDAFLKRLQSSTAKQQSGYVIKEK